MIAVINDFISTRGVSGSSRGADLIRRAVGEDESIVGNTVAPRRRPRTRIGRLAQMLTWDFVAAPREASRRGARIIVHATNTGRGRRGLASVVVMHDTMVLDHPELFNRWFVLYARLTFGLSVRAADVIVSPSLHSAAQIASRWPRAAARLTVIPWPAPLTAELKSSQGNESAGSFFVLVVSSMDKHKRLGLAVEVVSRLREESGEDVQLHMVVRAGNDQDAVLAQITSCDSPKSWVHLHEKISDAELSRLYADAGATLVPSLDEGYCLPAVESIARGTPVVHAGRGALPEVVPMYRAASAGQNDFEVLYERLLAVRQGSVLQQQLEDFANNLHHFDIETFRSRWLSVIKDLTE